MFCPNCGNSLKSGSRFCNKCGSKINPGSGNSTGNKPPHKPTKLKKYAPWIIGLSVLAICLAVVLVFVVFKPNATASGLTTGPSTHIASEQVDTGGGTISVDDGDLAGFSIDVLKDSYKTQVSFDISTAPIESHGFGDSFTPITPLITVDNEDQFADIPMAMKIPIQKEEDEFAMAFYYDEETKSLQPLPLLSLTNDELVTMTQHFSDIVVSKIDISGTSTQQDSGFVPGVNDFQIPNVGSYLNPNGYCAGQCISMAYYYQKSQLNGGQTLYGRFDNDGVTKTENIWVDDASAIRLCASVHVDYADLWYNPSRALKEYQFKTGLNDTDTLHATQYAMSQTGQPQIICVFNDTAGHAVLAYKITSDAIYVADPNYPGDTNRYIPYGKNSDGSITFGTYESGYTYDRVGFYGLYAMMNEKKTNALWHELIDGTPTMGVSVSDYFPKDVTIEAAVGMDINGDYVTKTLTDGFVLTKENIAKLGLTGGENLTLRISDSKSDDSITLITQTKEYGSFGGDFVSFALPEGQNRIGLWYKKDGSYVNFIWLDVVIGGTTSATPAPTQTQSQNETFTSDADLKSLLPGEWVLHKYVYLDGTEEKIENGFRMTLKTDGTFTTKDGFADTGRWSVRSGVLTLTYDANDTNGNPLSYTYPIHIEYDSALRGYLLFRDADGHPTIKYDVLISSSQPAPDKTQAPTKTASTATQDTKYTKDADLIALLQGTWHGYKTIQLDGTEKKLNTPHKLIFNADGTCEDGSRWSVESGILTVDYGLVDTNGKPLVDTWPIYIEYDASLGVHVLYQKNDDSQVDYTVWTDEPL